MGTLGAVGVILGGRIAEKSRGGRYGRFGGRIDVKSRGARLGGKVFVLVWEEPLALVVVD